jgi:predicted RNA-binding Zn-ribbon protein involved in translation (DUF1610 family)
MAEIIECANCGEKIGRLETPQVFKGEVVCAVCREKLGANDVPDWVDEISADAERPPSYETAAMTRRRMSANVVEKKSARCCPSCGSTEPPVKRRKGSMAMFLVLLFLMVLPALIYMVIYDGYVYVCPKCGAKIADAT